MADFEIQKITRGNIKSFTEAFKSDLIAQQSPYFNWNQQGFEDTVQNAQAWVLLQESTPCAMCAFQGAIDLWELILCFTAKSHHGKGLMMRLLSEVIENQLQASKISLEVHEKNTKAIQLYERLGFLLQASRQHYYSDKANALVYIWSKSCD